ncbi:hypothetical protein D3C87_1617270 [compost metagenome]
MAADRQATDHQAQQGTRGDTSQQTEFRWPAPGAQRVAGDIAGAAEEGRVAERQQARIADQQVESAGKQGKAQQLHQEDGIAVKRGRQRQQQGNGVAYILIHRGSSNT